MAVPAPPASAPAPGPLLSAIREIESSAGRDCGPGSAGERTCWQILPATARLENCIGWLMDEAAALACAQRWLARGARLCRRWDAYGRATWYNAGRCMRRGERPGAYAMDVARARHKYTRRNP